MKFKKRQRLCDKAAISLVFEQAEAKVQNSSGLILSRVNALSFDRLVVIVGKKKVKRAVDRNRIKRIVRHCFYEVSKGCFAKPADFVFVARPGILSRTDQDINTDQLHSLWVKLQKSQLDQKSPLKDYVSREGLKQKDKVQVEQHSVI